jgi:hypothetical protein
LLLFLGCGPDRATGLADLSETAGAEAQADA